MLVNRYKNIAKMCHESSAVLYPAIMDINTDIMVCVFVLCDLICEYHFLMIIFSLSIFFVCVQLFYFDYGQVLECRAII